MLYSEAQLNLACFVDEVAEFQKLFSSHHSSLRLEPTVNNNNNNNNNNDEPAKQLTLPSDMNELNAERLK